MPLCVLALALYSSHKAVAFVYKYSALKILKVILQDFDSLNPQRLSDSLTFLQAALKMFV